MNEPINSVDTKQRKRFADRQFRAAATFLVRYRRALALLLMLLAVGGLFFARNINIDNSLELWFLEDDPTLAAYREFKQKYGNDEIILAMIDCRRDGMFSPAMLSSVYKASKEIEADTENFRRVLSVGVAPYIGLVNDELIIEDIMLEPVETEADAAKIKERFMDDPFKRKILQNASSTWAIIIAEPVSSKDMDVRRPLIIESVRKKLAGFEYRLAGMGVMYDELNRLSIQDGAVFNAVAYVVIAVLVFILYRSWIFFFMTIGAMFLSGMSFLGFYGLFGQNFNMVTVVLPTLMMILSVSDVAYVYNNYCFNSDKIRKSREDGLIHVFNEVLSPCLFTSLTNTCGFFALTASSLAVLRTFGWFAGFACMAEYLVSMVVSVYILGRVELKEEVHIRRPMETPINWWMKRMPGYYRQILLIFALLTGVAIYGITQLNIDTYSMGFLQESNPVRVDSDKVEATYGNYLPLEVRLMTGKRSGILNVDFLQRLQKTHNDLEAVPGVEKAASIIDVLKKLNQVWSDGTEATYVVPDSDAKIAQLMMQYESDPDNDLEYMTDKPDYTEARLTVRVPMLSAAVLRDYEEKTKVILHQNFDGTGVTWKFGGYVPLYARIISYVTWSQVSSFALAFLFVFGAIAILFRRFNAMLLVVLPNVFPVMLTLGVMGLTGISLDIATVTIAAIALGIVVDDTIHGLYLFYDPSRSHLTPIEAIVDGVKESGPAMASTSLIYSLGFLFMVFASIKSIVYFGVLLSFTIVVALLCEITLLPAQICLLRRYLSKDFRSDEVDAPPAPTDSEDSVVN
ncbi:MAG: MMPL family transporter [Candidatus Riflebacteria bacterium]|nr:MMPL family transporter [Candidatus Riflebacteria bacterium]